jgi:pyruvate,water dikinase
VVDVGEGLKEGSAEKEEVNIEDTTSVPMRAIFKGLTHPDIHWGQFTHFDWAEFDRIVMAGGIISPESPMFASYAIVAKDYLNINLRFGYHFVIVDTICSDQAEENYAMIRFAGGGADFYQRSLRARFLKSVLERLGFEVDQKSDLVDGELKEEDKRALEQKLDMLGRLMGATRLMDMYLKDESMVETYVEEFMEGRYHFASSE